jgi:hypothetical protein
MNDVADLDEDFEPQPETPEVRAAKRRLELLGATFGAYGGVCPVQIEGEIGGEPFYFRSRGEKWRVWIGEGANVLDDRALFAEQTYRPEGTSDEDARYVAGYMPEHEALDLLRTCIERRMGLAV